VVELGLLRQRNVHGECLAIDDRLVGVRGLAQRDADGRRLLAADATPGGGHGVRPFVLVVRCHDPGGGW
jgi:hypothetical protein